MSMKIEFIPWYRAGVALVLCGGDDGCGALIGDADLHRKWHDPVFGTAPLVSDS
jgi:hypothetical protein